MRKLMMWSAFLGGSILAVMLGLTIWLGLNRVIVIADTRSEERRVGKECGS